MSFINEELADLSFSRISDSGMKLIRELSKSRDFLLYCRSLDDDPLAVDVPMHELRTQLISENDKLDGLFICSPSVNETALEERVYIFFYPSHPLAKYDMTESPVNDNLYLCEIIIPNKYTLIESGTKWRGFMIAEEISKALNGKNITGVGRTKVFSYGHGIMKNSQTFSILTLTIGVRHANAIRSVT